VIELFLDASSAVPQFEQLRAQVIDAVQAGTLVPGEKLPTVRGLAEQLGVAPGTVARSYRQLESDGVIETRGRSGSFVAATGDLTHQRAQAAAAAYAERMRELRLDRDAALELVRAALRSLPS